MKAYRIITLLSVFLLAGCGGEEAALRQQLEINRAKIMALEHQVTESGTRVNQVRIQQRQETEQLKQELFDKLEQLTGQIENQNLQIARLKESLAESALKVQAVERPVPQNPDRSPEPDPSRGPRLVMSTSPSEENIFPIRVFDVRGEQVVTGSHTAYRSKETGEMVKDDNGRFKPELNWEEETVNEYTYQVSYSVENLTETDQVITVRAGLKNEDVKIPGGQTLTNLSIQAAQGSTLLIMLGGRSQSFNVPF